MVKLFFSPLHSKCFQGEKNLSVSCKNLSLIVWKVYFQENRMTKHKATVSLIGLKCVIPEFPWVSVDSHMAE